MAVWGYESWFVSARDPGSRRALWIRHTRHRSRDGKPSAALWCTVVDERLGGTPSVVKQVFADLPGDAVAGPARFAGSVDGEAARWDLSITSHTPPVRPLRPAVLYHAPLPRTKLEASVPDGLVAGTVHVAGQTIEVSGWRGTAGHNWGSEHADSWVWLHAAGFDGVPDGWLELVLARVRVGGVLLPWSAFGMLCLYGDRVPLGGLGRRAAVDARPGRLAATVRMPGGRLTVAVTAAAGDTVAVSYADPRGGSRSVSHAAVARTSVDLLLPNSEQRSMSADGSAYEYGTSGTLPGIQVRQLPSDER